MLSELHIENFAIIQDLTLTIKEGLIVFTGETGAGKSIILDALEAVLGGRADTTSIRTGADRAVVEAIFKLEEPLKSRVNDLLSREDLLDDPDYIVLAREIRNEGRNTARINGRSVNVGLQRDIGSLLVDIHGQSEHLSLLKERNHLDLLDQFAGTGPLLDEYTKVYTSLRRVQKDLADLRQIEKDSARRVDVLSYQIQEIEAARLQIDEEDDLRQERTRLSNAEALSTLSQNAIVLLDEGTPENGSVSDMLGEVVRSLSDLNRIDATTQNLFEHAESTLNSISDLIMELRGYFENIEFNPRRLDQIEERIDLINSLKRKYGKDISEVLTYMEKAKSELNDIAHSEEQIEELTQKEGQLTQKLLIMASELSSSRFKATLMLSEQIEAQLDTLHMSNARFAVDMSVRLAEEGLLLEDGRTVAYDARGFDQVAFLVEPNPGEGLKPLVKIASGGETSRLMLALKNVLASADTIPVLIFDEIDQGVGGQVGMVVGEKLWSLSANHQVMCITHLPQLAAFGDQHFHVSKQIKEGRTSTSVELLENLRLRSELAQMLGPVTEGTLRSASEILDVITEKKRARQK